MPYGVNFVVTDRAIGVCTFCFRPIHREKCIAYGADLLCKGCLEEIVRTAAEGRLLVPVTSQHVEGEDWAVGSFLSTGDSDATQFACPVCGKKFASSQALAGHMRHCRGEEG